MKHISLAGLLPASYTAPIMSGQGLAGFFASVAMICAIASKSCHLPACRPGGCREGGQGRPLIAPGSPEGNTEGPGTASSEPLLPS